MMNWQRLIAATVLFMTLAVGVAARADEAIPSLVLMEVEFEGDLSDQHQVDLWPSRVALLQDTLRKDLGAHGLYDLRDNAAQAELFAALRKRSQVHDCLACVTDAGAKLGADRVMSVWIYRVSALILTLHARIRDVETGETLFSRSLDLRGDNDKAWLRAEAFLIREIEALPLDKR